MTSLEAIDRFVVPPDLVAETDHQLRTAGREGVERFVLWSGRAADESFVIETVHVPQQRAYKRPEGLMVRVDGDELHRLNVWLYEHQEQLGVQVHSHPTSAFHSDLDDSYPIVTVRGGLSIVVPDFGRWGVRGAGTAVYRLSCAGWDELRSEDAARLLRYEV